MNGLSRLLVRRDPLLLVEHEGRIETETRLPDFLKKPLTANPTFLDLKTNRPQEDLPIRQGQDVSSNPYEAYGILESGIPAVWSGYRSCLTLDEITGRLFRLKGVSFGKNPIFDKRHDYVRGGQFSENTEWEAFYSRKFNKILRSEGINPIMVYKGKYEFPISFNHRNLTTSIFEVIGDTRLDEFFYIMETLSINMPSGFSYRLNQLYEDIGFVVGRLKKLMDRNNMSWSDNPQRSNAHIGNIVVYRHDTQYIGVGLVDFDSSSDSSEKSSDGLREQQQVEFESVQRSALQGLISPRPIGRNYDPYFVRQEHRIFFIEGFIRGYTAEGKVNNLIESHRLENLLDSLPNVSEESKSAYLGRASGLGRLGMNTVLGRRKSYQNTIVNDEKNKIPNRSMNFYNLILNSP